MGLVDRISERKQKDLYSEKLEDITAFVQNKILEQSEIDDTYATCLSYIKEYCSRYYLTVEEESLKTICDYVHNILFGLGPIEKHLKNPSVTDIYVMGTRILYVENGIRKDDTEEYPNLEEVRRIAEKIATITHQTINTQNPHIDAELPDGSRALVVIPPVASEPYICIRKHTSRAKDLYQLRNGYVNMSDEMIEYFKKAVRDRKNIIAVGQTGAGKTTFLNALTYFIQPLHVVAILEDTREMCVPLKYVYYFRTRKGSDEIKPVTWTDILLDCLRANPDRIIIAEIRTPEAAYEFLDALNSGHAGSMTTIHASNTLLALQKLEMKVKEYRPTMDDKMIRMLISNTVDIVVYIDTIQDELGNIKGRVVKEILELERGINPDGTYKSRYVYNYNDLKL